MASDYKLVHSIDVPCLLGENALWDHRVCCFWWTDILDNKVYRWWFKEDKLDTFALNEPLCSFGLTSDPDVLICAFSDNFALFAPVNNKKYWSLTVNECRNGVRMNDGRVDPAGRFWAGSMDQNHQQKEFNGQLYRLDSETKYTAVLSNIHISNGLSWSPDGAFMYFTDSPTEEIKRYPFDLSQGDVGHVSELARTRRHVHPDGCCVDVQGGVWSAHWNGSQVVRYMPNGETDVVLAVPPIQPTSVCFGGDRMTHLFVTSALDGLLNQRDSSRDGRVFVYQTPNTGKEQAICTLGRT